MADGPTLSPEVSRSVSALARTPVAAARSWTRSPADHPTADSSPERLRRATLPLTFAGDVPASLRRRLGVLAEDLSGDPAKIGVVTHEHPSDPLRPHVNRIRDRAPRVGAAFDEPVLVNTWDADGHGDYTWSVVEAVDPDEAGIEPMQYM
jgi:hypothetical protein